MQGLPRGQEFRELYHNSAYHSFASEPIHSLTSKLHSLPWFPSFPGGSEGKTSAYNAGDPGSILGSGRSPGEGNGNPLQYSCLENQEWTEEPGRLQSVGSQRVGHD